MAGIDEKVRRLQELRKKVDEISQKKQRLAGELDGHKKRQVELEKQCNENYGCKVEDLPDLIKQLEEESQKSLEAAEHLLSIPAAQAQEEVKQLAPAPVSPIPPTPVKTAIRMPFTEKGSAPNSVIRRVIKPVALEDEDVL